MNIRFFQHDEQNGGDFDDSVKITRVGEDSFDLLYIMTSPHRVIRRVELPLDRVMEWTRNMLRLVLADDDPFALIQLEVPTMPVTLFRVGELMENFEVFTNAVWFSLANWPADDGIGAIHREDDASTVTYTTDSDEEALDDDEEHHPSPPPGGEPMDEEDEPYDRHVNVDSDGALVVRVQERGTHHLYFDSDTDSE